MGELPLLLVGCGRIGTTHAGVIHDIPSVRLAAVCDPDPAARARAKAAAGAPDAVEHADYRELLASKAAEGEATIVATLPALHREITVASLESGRPVLCEKPMAPSIGDARAMVAAAQRTGLLLMDASSRKVLDPELAYAREMVRSGALGVVFRADLVGRFNRLRCGIEYQPETTAFLSRASNGGGALMDLGTYDLTAIARAVGVPDAVTVAAAFSVQIESDRTPPPELVYDVESFGGASLTFRYDDGRPPVVVRYERSMGANGPEEHWARIEGTAGSLRWRWWHEGPPVVEHWFDRDGDVVREVIKLGEWSVPNHQHPVLLFAQELSSGGTLAVHGHEALRYIEILHTIYDVAERGVPADLSWGQR